VIGLLAAAAALLAAQDEKVALAFRIRTGDRFTVTTTLRWKTDLKGAERNEEIQSTVSYAVGEMEGAGVWKVQGTFRKFRRTDRGTGRTEVDWSQGTDLAGLPADLRTALEAGIAAKINSRGAMASESRALPIIFHQSGGGLFGTLCALPPEPMKPGESWIWGGLGTQGHGRSIITTTLQKIEGGSAVLGSKFRSEETLRNQFELFYEGEATAHFDLRAGFPASASGKYRQLGRDTKQIATASYEFEVAFARQ
jgi:hypothetical protein